MSYYSGFVAAVPTASKQVYVDHARQTLPFFRKFGALRQVEAWGEDVPAGKLTDFRRAVQAKDDETVVFGWVEWPDRATADASWEKMQTDPEMEKIDMPFDGSRMIWGGFAPAFEEGKDQGAGWYQGFVVAVPGDKKQAYVDMARFGWEKMFQNRGALYHIEAWGEDVPHGKLTDFYRAVQAEDGEVVVFSWIGWPDRATADAANKAMMEDPAMAEMGDMDMPFDGKRMIWGGFAPILDSARADG